MDLRLTEFGIRQFISDGQEFVYGRTMSKEGRVAGVRLVESDNIKFVGRIAEEGGREQLAEIWFDENGAPSGCRCSCERGLCCRHVSALMFELMNSKGEKQGDLSANYVASKNLLNLFEKRRLDDMKKLTVAAAEKLDIEPVLCFENGNFEIELYLSKVGKRKKKIPDIFEFTTNVDRNTGKAFREYAYNISGFTDTGRSILDFIYSRSEVRSGYIALSSLSEDKGRFILSGAAMDDFFELFKDRKIKMNLEGVTSYVKLFEGEPYAKVFIETDEGKAKLKKNFEPTAVIATNRFGYILLENKLYRTDPAYAAAIKDIEAAFEISGKPEIVFEKPDYPRLVDFVLPVLNNFDLLEDVGGIYGRLSMTPFKAQLFVEAKGSGLCGHVKFVYGDTVIDYADKRAYREYRNDRAETVFRLALEGMGFYDGGGDGFLMLREENIFKFLRYGINALRKDTEVYLSDELKVFKQSAEKTINLGIKSNENLIEIDFDPSLLNLGELKKVLTAYEERKKYYRFSDGRFFSIDDNKMFLKFIKLFDPKRKDLEKGSFTASSGRLMIFDRLFDENEKRLIAMDKGCRRLLERFSDGHLQDSPLPDFYKGILRDYQKKGYRWLKALGDCGFGGVLADDMGLGKTIQMISCLYDRYKTEGETKPSLVVCPTSLIFNWEAELEAYGGGLDFEIVYGSRAKRQESLAKDKQLFITSYEVVKRDFSLFSAMDFAVVVADEAQYIKNHTTANFTSVTSLKADTRFALTGTPFENRLGELWSVFEFVMPSYLGSFKKFSTEFEKPIMKNQDRGKMKMLKKLISPFVLRREKGDVLRDLPEKSETNRYMVMTEEQSKLYKAELLKARGVIKADFDNNEFNRIKILREITRLRQICCYPSLYLENYKGESGKLNYFLENIGGFIEKGHKLLIFSQFTSMLAIIKDRLSLMGIDFYYIDGQTAAEERLRLVNAFNSGGKVCVFLISLKAGGTGLNLTGADIVIHFDQWWNPAVMEQAADRAHRFGQVRRVQVYNLITKGTIEEKIMRLQRGKRQLFNDVLNLEGGTFADMSREDILELFS